MACWISAPTVSVVVVVGVGETTKGKDEEVAAPTTLGEVVVDEVGDETADVLVTGSDEEVVDSTAVRGGTDGGSMVEAGLPLLTSQIEDKGGMPASC
jgi:hypothetical protein